MQGKIDWYLYCWIYYKDHIYKGYGNIGVMMLEKIKQGNRWLLRKNVVHVKLTRHISKEPHAANFHSVPWMWYRWNTWYMIYGHEHVAKSTKSYSASLNNRHRRQRFAAGQHRTSAGEQWHNVGRVAKINKMTICTRKWWDDNGIL